LSNRMDEERESDHSDWSDAPELDEEVTVTKSLFSTFEGTTDECLKNDRLQFGWALDDLALGPYDFIKLINFCRAKKFEKAPEKEAILGELRAEWEQDHYYRPTMPDDAFLMHEWDKDVTRRIPMSSDAKPKRSDTARRMEIETLLKETELGPNRENAGYFEGYADYGIHAEMLQDKVRTESYRDTIYKNAHLFKDKIVVDVGAGTGILSLFAAQCGAKTVYAMEMSDIAFDCMDVIRENGFESKIKVMKGAAEDMCAKIPLCDIIVSEWMGYCCLFEGMLDSVLAVRDKLLKPSGYMIPATASIDICLVRNESLWHEYLGFWEDVYGFKMKCLRTRARREARVHTITADEVASTIQNLISWDLKDCSVSSLSFTKPVRLTSTITGLIHGITASFDCDMLCGDNVTTPVNLSTSPFEPTTHWKQTTFLFDEAVKVVPGSIVDGTMEIRRKQRNERELEVQLKLTLEGNIICNQKYSVS